MSRLLEGLFPARFRDDVPRVYFPPPYLNGLGVLLGGALHRFVHPLPIGAPDFPWHLLAFCITPPGGLLLSWGMRTFTRHGERSPSQHPTRALVEDGPYVYSRNPMFIGVTLMQLGVGVMLNNLWTVLLVIPTLVYTHYAAILPEEDYLRRTLGEPYRQFCARTRRYL